MKNYVIAFFGTLSGVRSVNLFHPKPSESRLVFRLVALSVVWLFSFQVKAQTSLGTSLLGASGGTFYSGNVGITFSLGETLVEHTSQATFGVLQHDPLGLPTVKVSEIALTNFNLFPNPNEGNFQLSGVPETCTNWQVYDLRGRLVESGSWKESGISMKTSTAQGLYVLRLMNDSGEVLVDRKFSILR